MGVAADISGGTTLVGPGDGVTRVDGQFVWLIAVGGDEDTIRRGGGGLANNSTVFFGDDKKVNEKINETSNNQVE